jgi:hypothetical protein
MTEEDFMKSHAYLIINQLETINYVSLTYFYINSLINSLFLCVFFESKSPPSYIIDLMKLGDEFCYFKCGDRRRRYQI